MKVAIFGGTFDPFTTAHKAIVDEILKKKKADYVYIVPTIVEYHRPGKERWLSDCQRVSVIKQFFSHEEYGGTVGVWDGEIKAKNEIFPDEAKKSFVASRRFIHTLISFKRSNPNAELITVLGTDSLENFRTWFQYEEILKLSTILAVQGRDNEECVTDIPHDAIMIPPEFARVSASKIREAYREKGVGAYIQENVSGFNPQEAFETIKRDWCNWAHNKVGAKKFVVGISGGKDSTVVAWLAAKIFGPENVYGVMLPNGHQKDKGDAEWVIRDLGIKMIDIQICASVDNILGQIGDASELARVNLPPRIRLAALYAVAQTVGGIVLNTSNLTEDILGYATLWGDTCGSYAPIQHLTVTEVIRLGEWLGIPDSLIHKVPSDGLQDQTDEDRLGLKYADADRLIRDNVGTDELREKVMKLYRANRFKIDMISLPGPKFENLPNYIARN